MLYKFLRENRKAIIRECKSKVLAAAESKPTSSLFNRGLPVFYDEVIEVLERTAISKKPAQIKTITKADAAEHGKESLRLGYTISQVVHGYGAVCQSITEFAKAKSYKITADEFHDFNLSLDIAIAEAVTEFDKVQKEHVTHSEIERLGCLIHEMGNALAVASIAHGLLKKGVVGTSGSTSRMLSSAHERMHHLIGSSLAEVRLRGNAKLERAPMRLLDIISEVEATAMIADRSKDIHLKIEVDPTIQMTADRHLIFSALSNLLNNAIKFTRKNGHISIRARKSGKRILIEVEDECGGLKNDKTEELFKPFIQDGADRTGMGLGLPLSRRAIELNRGKLTARNLPKKGCVFTIDLPQDEK